MRVKAGTREGDIKWYSSIRSIVSQQCERASSIASHAAGHPILYSGGICVVASGSTESCQAANLSAVVGLLWDLTPINILSERESCDFLWHLAVGPPVSVNSALLCLWWGRGIPIVASLLSSLLFNVCFLWKRKLHRDLDQGSPSFLCKYIWNRSRISSQFVHLWFLQPLLKAYSID